ncbi:MAG: hypothetical protein ICV55_09630 [Coleofasciculus sp. C3-bin4]|nr:hypothetical protein [Coleofasciculus sp. C3-bin4]
MSLSKVARQADMNGLLGMRSCSSHRPFSRGLNVLSGRSLSLLTLSGIENAQPNNLNGLAIRLCD